MVDTLFNCNCYILGIISLFYLFINPIVYMSNSELSAKIFIHKEYKGRFVDKEGLFFPNFTKPCIEWLLKVQLNNFNIYEYGAEASAKWWRLSCKNYVGITNNERLSQLLECKYHFDMDNYVNDLVKTNEEYDLIVINGRWRDACIISAIQRIKNGGYILINNYHQERTDYRPSYWELTTPILEKYPMVIFHDENKETNNRTAIWQIIK